MVMAAGGAFAAPPGPGQHFNCSDGGSSSCATDDTGCVSQTKDDPSNPTVKTEKCGDGLAKAFGKAIAAVGKCHKSQITAAFKAQAPQDDEACEESNGGKSAKEKLQAAI